jgi:hypothetical protein
LEGGDGGQGFRNDVLRVGDCDVFGALWESRFEHVNINASGMVTTRNVTTIVAVADEAIFFVGEYYPARVDAICTGKKNTELARLC